MSLHSSILTLFAVPLSAIVFVCCILLSSSGARAEDRQLAVASGTCEVTDEIAPSPRRLDERDKIALLERIQYALSAIGDGSTYVWRRWHGALSATVQPTASFKDDGGQICRHVVILLSNGKRSKKTEGIACRLPNGRWQLDG